MCIRDRASIECGLNLIISAVITISLAITILAIDFKLSTFNLVIFGLSYLFIIFLVKGKVKVHSKKQIEYDRNLLKLIRESIANIKNIILYNFSVPYTERFRVIDKKRTQILAHKNFIIKCPKSIIEGLSLSVIAFLALILVNENNDNNITLGILSLIALAAQKILPYLQSIYSFWIRIKGNKDLSLIHI